MEAEQQRRTPPDNDEISATQIGGLRSQKRTKTAYARVNEEGPTAAAPAQTQEEEEEARPRGERSVPRRVGYGRRRILVEGEQDREVSEEWNGFGVGEVEVEEYEEHAHEYEEEDYDGGPRRRTSSIAIALLVLFLALGVVGFLAKQMYSGAPPGAPLPAGERESAEAAAAGASPGVGGAPEEGKEDPARSAGLAPDTATAEGVEAEGSAGRVEETGLVVSQQDDGQGGLYVTIGEETWHGALSAPEEGAVGEVLKLEGPTAVNINTGFATKDPEAVVDHGSFGIYEPGGGLMYATVQRTEALGAQEATTRGTYSVIGKSGEQYTGNYSDSAPDPETDRVVRVYTVEKVLPPEAGADPEGRAPEPEVETLAVAFELPRLEGEGAEDRPLVPQLVGWHAPDGTELHEIVDAPK